MMVWTEQDAEQVIGLLTTFSGADEVCAVMGCDKSELDRLCRESFDVDFKTAKDRYHAQGRAMLRKALFEQALDGSAKALDMLAREQLGIGPVETRKKVMDAKEGDDADEQAKSVLALVQGRRKGRRDQATA